MITYLFLKFNEKEIEKEPPYFFVIGGLLAILDSLLALLLFAIICTLLGIGSWG